MVESIEVVCNLPITLTLGCTIYKDFIIVKYYKSTLIFSNQLLKKYNCVMDWKTDELKIRNSTYKLVDKHEIIRISINSDLLKLYKSYKFMKSIVVID